MKRFFTYLLILGVLLFSCTASSISYPATIAPQPTLINTRQSTEWPTISPPAVNTPTLISTALPEGTVEYYRLQIVFTTTSDWSTLDLENSDNVLAMRTLGTTGQLTGMEATLQHLSLTQPLDSAKENKSISMTVVYALDPKVIRSPLNFTLEKGDLNKSTIDISVDVNGVLKSVKTIAHAGVTRSGTNPRAFTLDLFTALENVRPQSGQIMKPDTQKMLWAFYYSWYTKNDWSSPWLKDWPVEPYASSDPAVITQQVEQAQSAGIDGFISSWWGPGSDTDQNLRKLLSIAGEKHFWVSIYFETLAGENGAPLGEAKIYEWLGYAIQQYGSHPAFMKVDGKPLIVVWASAEVPLATWARIFAKLRTQGLDAYYLAMGYDPANLEVFDGLHDYGIFTYPDLTQTNLSASRSVRNYPLLADNPIPRIWIATVQPGYDDTLQPSRQGQVQDREGGDYYRSTWKAALQSDPDWIFITTWNEWYEHTHIEPSKSFGNLYLDITREYADLWKGK